MIKVTDKLINKDKWVELKNQVVGDIGIAILMLERPSLPGNVKLYPACWFTMTDPILQKLRKDKEYIHSIRTAETLVEFLIHNPQYDSRVDS